MTITESPTQPPAPRPPARPSTVIARIVLSVVLLALVGMWVYAFGFAGKQGLYVLDDTEWTERAQAICADYALQRFELGNTEDGYIPNPTAAQMNQRADLVDQATDLLEAQLADMFAVQPQSERDQALAAEYRGFSESLIADRRAYTGRLRDGVLGPYLETKVDGGPVTNILTDFTTANRMKRCAPPGELGGDNR